MPPPRPAHTGDRVVPLRTGVRLEEVRCEWVVDATGRRAAIGRGQGRYRKQDRLVAVYALFARRLPGRRSEDTELGTLVEAVPGGWWYMARVPAGRLVAHLTDTGLAGCMTSVHRASLYMTSMLMMQVSSSVSDLL
ncbi:NAD(P)/FAD-dependent oxidoreductase [Streptomyces sp. CA-179760]|uniref:NAD(P)/FAD-dependent oxidoreductase n=1 Tax=Streptomyces sp. CA-179760 TaxID=3240054 RepID=UPI003D8DE12A